MSQEEQNQQIKVQKILIQLNKTGLSYLKHLKFAQAIEFFKKAQKIATEELNINTDNQKINQLIGVTYNNLACYYKKTKKPKVALKYLQKSLELQVYKINDWVSTGSTHLNICAIYSYLGKHHEALSHVNLAIQLLDKKCPEDRDRSEEAKSYWNIRMLCYYNKAIQQQHLKQLQICLPSYEHAKQIAKREGSKNITIIMNCDEAITRIQTYLAGIKKKMIDIMIKRKQEDQQGHYEYMRKHKPIPKRQLRQTSQHQLVKFDIYKGKDFKKIQQRQHNKSHFQSAKAHKRETSNRFKSLNEYITQKYKTEGAEKVQQE